jgi:putative colanic acid biosynthesis UDP-glucose lipid carrier transferase
MVTKWILKQIKEYMHFIADLYALNLVYWALIHWPFDFQIDKTHLLILSISGNVILSILYTLLWPQNQNRSWTYTRHIKEIFRSVCIQFVVIFMINMFVFSELYTNILLIFLFLLSITTGIGRFAVVMFLRHIRVNGYNFNRVIIVGSEELVASFKNELHKNPHYGYRLVGSFNQQLILAEYSGYGTEESTDIFDFLIRENIDEVFVSSNLSKDAVTSLMKFCQLNGIVINITYDLFHGVELTPLNMSLKTGGITPTITIREEWYSGIMRSDAKRIFDLVSSLFFLIFIGSWLFPIIALVIKLDNKGPVFFKQQRSGLNNKIFYCLKFRTMKVNAESDTRQATAGDERITRFGRFLRKSNLDELPQLINVLLGDMSIVGPRPHMLKHTEEYGKMVENYNERLWIKPGITGLAQSKGFRGEIREVSQLINRIYHDRYYIRNWSFLLDLKIIAFTVWNMISLQRLGV